MPHPANTVPDYVRMSRHEWDLDDDGHEVIEHAVAVETDTSLVLAPDGLGGVEFRAESGGTGGAVWAPLMVNNPNIVTTTGEVVYVPLCTADGVPILIEVVP